MHTDVLPNFNVKPRCIDSDGGRTRDRTLGPLPCEGECHSVAHRFFNYIMVLLGSLVLQSQRFRDLPEHPTGTLRSWPMLALMCRNAFQASSLR